MNDRISSTDFSPADSVVYSLRSTWKGLIADLSFKCGDLHVEMDTTEATPTLSLEDKWCQLSVKSTEGRFLVYLPAALLVSMFEGISKDLQLENIEPNTAALMLEHALTADIARLEAALETDFTFLELTDFSLPANNELFGIEFHFNGTSELGALAVDGQVSEAVEYAVQENSFAEEKGIEPELLVHLGPVVLPTRDAYLATKGSTIDCGVKPTEVIKGVLMRSDGRYWPIHIEDDAVEIAGELSAPVDFSSASDEHVFVTFAVGSVELKPIQRKQLEPGHRLQIERYPQNGATVHYQTVPYAQGTIMLMGDNLAINISELEMQMPEGVAANPKTQN